MDNCAGVNETVPLVACGQMNLPRSSLFANRHSPSPSNHNILIRSPRRPRNTNTCPENGFSLQRRLHHPTQSRKTTPQIGHSCGDPDPRSCWQTDHRDQTLQHCTQRHHIYRPRNTERSFRILGFPSFPIDRQSRHRSAASAGCPSETFTGSSGVAAPLPSRPSR